MMKRLLYRLIAGLVTFAVGLGLTSIWNAHRAISLCELDANPSLYGGKTIRFRAMVDKTRNRITASSFCDADSAPAVSIELDPGEIAKFPLLESFVSASGEADRIYLMDAVIVGQLDPHFGPGCWGPKYQLSKARIERGFSIQKFEDISQAVTWTKSNSY